MIEGSTEIENDGDWVECQLQSSKNIIKTRSTHDCREYQAKTGTRKSSLRIHATWNSSPWSASGGVCAEACYMLMCNINNVWYRR